MNFIIRMVIFAAFLAVMAAPFPAVRAQACGTGPGMLCYGYNYPECTTVILPDCSAYPRCSMWGGGSCLNHCYNTGKSCGGTATCLCLNAEPCPLCAGRSGQDLSICTDDGCGPADSTPPTITITSPTSGPSYATSAYPMDLGGTASDDNIVTQVTWSNSRNAGFVGGLGSATGTTSWNISYVNLEPGENIITVAAKDGRSNTGIDVITVTYNPPATPGYPIITLEENASSYLITIDDPDPLTEVSYAWGVKPNIYFLVPFASDSTPVLSSIENDRYNYLIANLPAAWDNLTLNKHPVNFYFMEPFVLQDYDSVEDDWFKYITRTVSRFESDYSGILAYPAVYIILYPEPYFSSTYTNRFGTEEKTVLAEVYISTFNDENSDPDEILSNIILHELTHDFADLPSNANFPPGDSKYFWQGHPAGFYGLGGDCGENVDISDCPPFGAAESPTGTEGYYEVYSIISLQRDNYLKSEMGGRGPELSPLVEMAMGIRSKYEDANFTYYEGYFNPAGFHLTAVHDYGISCRWLHDYGPERDAYAFDRWSIHRDSPKTQLVNTTVAFSLLKSDQSGRSLLVFAGDSQYPGYFKAFGANAQSDVVMSPSLCIHESDMDCDNCVSRTELFAFIDLWYVNSSDPTLKELIEAIGLWKRGGC